MPVFNGLPFRVQLLKGRQAWSSGFYDFFLEEGSTYCRSSTLRRPLDNMSPPVASRPTILSVEFRVLGLGL